MSYAPQSSPGLRRLPACLALLATLAGPLYGQEERALAAPSRLLREPSGVALASLSVGTLVEPGKARGDWRQITIEGWIYARSTSPTRREGFDLVVVSDGGENLRRDPNGTVLGRLREGTLLHRVGSRGQWLRVRRAGWVLGSAVAPGPTTSRLPAQAGAQTPPAPPRKPAPRAEAPPPERVEVAGETALNATPDGSPYGTLAVGAPARVVGRSGDWTRVQVEGWVKSGDLKPSAGGALAGVSAAEVREAPDQYVGQMVDWRVQLIAVQTADDLRAEMAPGQPYLLTRGPLPEPGFVYVAIPPARVDEFKALPPLRELTLRVSIRAARTRYLTTPVVELVDVLAGKDGK